MAQKSTKYKELEGVNKSMAYSSCNKIAYLAWKN